MNVKAILVFLVFLTYSYFTGKYYVCDIKNACTQSSNAVDLASDSDIVGYAYEGYDAITGVNFDTYKLNLLTELGESNKLKITGLYSPSEENTSGSVDLGIARAMSFRRLFSEIDDSRFILSSEAVPLDDSKASIEGVEWKVLVSNEYIEEIENAVVIHFDSNSEEGDLNPTINDYLTRLANEHSSSNKSLDVVGHSDNQGDAGNNFDLALSRAKAIKEVLIAKGMPEDMVHVTSKGETEPIAENSSEEGRAKNRRVEILIN